MRILPGRSILVLDVSAGDYVPHRSSGTPTSVQGHPVPPKTSAYPAFYLATYDKNGSPNVSGNVIRSRYDAVQVIRPVTFPNSRWALTTQPP
jgi:hypothetical protein